MELPSNLFIRRIKTLGIILTCLGALIIGRLIQLQINNFTRFFVLGKRNFSRTETIVSPRGTILDCKGRPLATNMPVTTLYWQGTGNKTLKDHQHELITHIEELTTTQLNIDEIVQAEAFGKRIIIGHDVSFDCIRALIERYPSHKNLIFATSFKRNYPHQKLACHVLGYLGSITSDPKGQMGLEKIYEEALKGNPGEIRQTVNSKGALLAEEEIKKAQKGSDLATTIDLDLQMFAEEIFPEEHAGVFIVMNPKNGALRVALSHPTFDPNCFTQAIDPELWAQLQSGKKAFINRAFNALYPPASLFKLVSISAALDTKIIDMNATWYCSGYTTFAGRRYHCHKHEGHGTMSTIQAVEQSCNIPFFDIGKKIKIDQLADYAFRFGLGTTTNSVFPEKAGLVPTSKWKREVKGEAWWPGETLSAAIGQSFFLVTPIQIARMVGAICEGYLVRPCIVEREAQEQEQGEKQKLMINESTREFLKQSMIRVVKKGTGQWLSRLSDITIYAKTGTAQTRSSLEDSNEERFRDHAWFVAYIQFRHYEPMVLLVFLENAGFSTAATQIAKQFLSRYCKFVDAHPEDYTL